MTKITKYTDLMLDLETLGQSAGCVIISIAAVPFFKLEGQHLPAEKCFHRNVDIQSCLDAGMKIDPATLGWWIQKAMLFQELQEDTFHLKGTLERLGAYIRSNCEKDVRVWGKGPSFDNAIIRDAYDRFQMKLPWEYYRERCVRTYLDGYTDLLKKYLPFEGVIHHPVYDAIHQVRSMAKVQTIVMNPYDYENELD